MFPRIAQPCSIERHGRPYPFPTGPSQAGEPGRDQPGHVDPVAIVPANNGPVRVDPVHVDQAHRCWCVPVPEVRSVAAVAPDPRTGDPRGSRRADTEPFPDRFGTDEFSTDEFSTDECSTDETGTVGR
nr:hypothetical protein ISGA_5220 [Gordonia sp. NB41Y]